MAPAAAQPRPIGIFSSWGAFEAPDPRKCYAIARALPGSGTREQPPSASVAYWPQRQVRRQIHLRLSRAAREGSAVILRVDDKSFLLRARGADAWAPDARADARIVAAMRTGVAMSVESRSRRGARFRDRYLLRGAATAIDAAAIACAGG